MPDESEGLVPRPDPTILTTEQLLREVSNSKLLSDSQLETLRERLRGMDRATDLVAAGVNRVPTDVDRQTQHLQELMLRRVDSLSELMVEKFGAVAEKFGDLERRTAEQKADTKAAVDAALQAAKEAVGQQTEASERSIAKSEAATTKQIDAVTALLSTSNAATGATIDDLKSRMDRMESAKLGGSDQRDNQRAMMASLIGVGLFVLTVAGFIIALAVKP